MTTYHKRIMDLPPGPPQDRGDADCAYLIGHRDARHAAVRIAAAADARVAELEAECARLRLALDYIANNSGENSHFARAALAATDAGAATGNAPMTDDEVRAMSLRTYWEPDAMERAP